MVKAGKGKIILLDLSQNCWKNTESQSRGPATVRGGLSTHPCTPCSAHMQGATMLPTLHDVLQPFLRNRAAVSDISSVKCLSALPVHIPSAEGCSSASWHVPSASNSDLGSASFSVLSFRAIPSILRQVHHASYCFLVSINCHSKSSCTGGSIIPQILKLPFGKAFGERSDGTNLQSLQLW